MTHLVYLTLDSKVISIECHLQIIGNYCANDLHSWSKEEKSLPFEQT